MKDKGVFNKIINRADVEKENLTDEEKVEQVTVYTKPGDSAKAQMPPVKPSTIILMCLFALLFAVGYFFAPYLTHHFIAQTINCEVSIPQKSYEQLMTECHSIVIGRSISQRTAVGDDLTTDTLVYTEHLFEVEQILYGEPYMENSKQLITYTLGGKLQEKDYWGRPKTVEYKYTDAASIGSESVLLFLDDQNNIISERYGLYKKHADGQYYDVNGKIYSVDKIKADIAYLIQNGTK